MRTRFLARRLANTVLFVALGVGGCVGALGCGGGVRGAQAADLPMAAGSPIAGINFDDRPLILPVQRNFQMAMLTASSELGRSCGKIEAYGWRLAANEQERVDVIFNNTVDRLRAQGYAVESRAANTVSKDVTLFTADRQDKHMIFMWSAGEIGLVSVLCETSAPLGEKLSVARASDVAGGVGGGSRSGSGAAVLPNGLREKTAEAKAPMGLYAAFKSAQTQGQNLGQGQAQTQTLPERPAMQYNRAGREIYENFSPLGVWQGSYTCSQGTTGARLRIDSLRGDQFKGVFSFYPTAKNPYVPQGSYEVSGEYDRDSHRILINPGKWLDRPENYFNTIMIGSFNPANMTFSAYFQGIMGCTSFEARFDAEQKIVNKAGDDSAVAGKAEKKKAVSKKAAVKKKVAKKKPAPESTTIPTAADLSRAVPQAGDSGAAEVGVSVKAAGAGATPTPASAAPAASAEKTGASLEKDLLEPSGIKVPMSQKNAVKPLP